MNIQLSNFIVLKVIDLINSNYYIIVGNRLRYLLGYVQLALVFVALDELGDHDHARDRLGPDHDPEVVYRVRHGTLRGYIGGLE